MCSLNSSILICLSFCSDFLIYGFEDFLLFCLNKCHLVPGTDAEFKQIWLADVLEWKLFVCSQIHDACNLLHLCHVWFIFVAAISSFLVVQICKYISIRKIIICLAVKTCLPCVLTPEVLFCLWFFMNLLFFDGWLFPLCSEVCFDLICSFSWQNFYVWCVWCFT